MSRFTDNSEDEISAAKGYAHLAEFKMWAYLVAAIVYALLDIADALRGK